MQRNDNTTSVAESPRISVIIPAYGPTPHLEEILDAIVAGTLAPFEIIVSHSGSNDPTVALAMTHPDVLVLHCDARLFAGAARNRGAQRAQGDLLAFCDSDVLPGRGWLERLAASITALPAGFVVGSVGMARTGGYWGRSNWLLEFSEMAPWRKAGEQAGGASCNMMVLSEDFRRAGGFDETMTPGEDTLLFAGLRRSGLVQWFEPTATCGHFNHSGFAAFTHHQIQLGANFTRTRLVCDLGGYTLVRRGGWRIGLLGLAKASLVSKRSLFGGFRAAVTLAFLAPGVLLGSAIWAMGCRREAARQKNGRSVFRE